MKRAPIEIRLGKFKANYIKCPQCGNRIRIISRKIGYFLCGKCEYYFDEILDFSDKEPIQ